MRLCIALCLLFISSLPATAVPVDEPEAVGVEETHSPSQSERAIAMSIRPYLAGLNQNG